METMDNMQIKIFSAYDKNKFLSNIQIPVPISGFNSYNSISSSELYYAVGTKYDIPPHNIVLYYKNRCLRFNKRNSVYPAVIDVQLAVYFPNKENLQEYLHCHYTAKKCDIPIFESIEVMDQQDRTICTIVLVRHDTTVKKIRDVVASLIKTEAFDLLHNNTKRLLDRQLIANVCFESGIFKPTIKLFVNIKDSVVTEKHVRVVNLEFLSRRVQLDIFENELYNTARLRLHILRNYKIPIRQQKLICASTIIEEDDEQLLNDLYIEDESNYTGSILISVMIEPCHINVKFASYYVEISGVCMQLPGMTTIKEIKERLGGITGLSPETLALLELPQMPTSLTFYDDTYLHELPHKITGVVEIKVLGSILVQIPDKEIFSQCISHKCETIREMKRQLEIDNDCGTLVFVSKINGENLRAGTRILDLVDKEITLTFERHKSCVLL